ncbi:MAG: N-6 DNA methylase, partial [Myxococcales bacterium]|nr:N-6 DNA methylase [Myxococcales bacterium]
MPPSPVSHALTADTFFPSARELALEIFALLRDLDPAGWREGLATAARERLERVSAQLRELLDLAPSGESFIGLRERLGELVLLVGTIGLGAPEDRARDVLGRVYEYFLTSFAAAEGKKGGQFYTPVSIVKLLVNMLEPYKGRVYDPCC